MAHLGPFFRDLTTFNLPTDHFFPQKEKKKWLAGSLPSAHKPTNCKRAKANTDGNNDGVREPIPADTASSRRASQDIPPSRRRAPSASQVLAVLTLLPLIGVILTCTVIGLAVATPLFVFFSLVLVPAMVAIGLAVMGFLESEALGLTALVALSWMLSNGRGRRRMVEVASGSWPRKSARRFKRKPVT